MQIDRSGFNVNTNMQTSLPSANVNNINSAEMPQFTIPMPDNNISPSQHKQDLELMKQCKEFESVLINQMFKQMRPKAQEEDLFGSTKDREMFNSMLDEERTKAWAQEGGMGLANIMFQQMKNINK